MRAHTEAVSRIGVRQTLMDVRVAAVGEGVRGWLGGWKLRK